MYRVLFDHLATRIDPEKIHHLALEAIGLAGAIGPLRGAVGAAVGRQSVGTPLRAFGRELSGPLGIAAGFDKDGRAICGLMALGFSHVEIGTLTARAQPGNPAPRLWRITEQDALRNQMGFNNAGAAAAAMRLRRLRQTAAGRRAVVGVNIGKSKVTPPDQAAHDYATSARLLAPWADYLVVNVSSPNTPGLRDLQAVQALAPILAAARASADRATRPDQLGGRRVPLLVKIAPDLADADIDAIADLAGQIGLDGIVAVNTTIRHTYGPGGLSGRPLKQRGVEVVTRLRDRLGPDAVIIGVGGITTARDGQDYLDAGANLIQAYTGFIYGGPAWPGRIGRALAA